MAWGDDATPLRFIVGIGGIVVRQKPFTSRTQAEQQAKQLSKAGGTYGVVAVKGPGPIAPRIITRYERGSLVFRHRITPEIRAHVTRPRKQSRRSK
jgi:hypothetical protein